MQWNIIGHERQKAYFERVLRSSQDGKHGFSHAYLFTGPRGIGKRAFADEFAAMLGPGSDRMVLGPEVEAARAMKSWAYLRPLYGERKVVVVDDADQLSDAAANTLLKVLEEPPAYLHFLLISSRAGQVLPTIASRCQEVAFQPLDDADMRAALAGLRMDADDRKLLAAVAAGRPGIARELVRERKLPLAAKAIAGLEKALTVGVAERLRYAKTIADDDDAPGIVSWWLAWMHAQLPARPQLTPVIHSLLDLHAAISDTRYNRRLAVEKFFLEVIS